MEQARLVFLVYEDNYVILAFEIEYVSVFQPAPSNCQSAFNNLGWAGTFGKAQLQPELTYRNSFPHTRPT